jgi:hypothetical protein
MSDIPFKDMRTAAVVIECKHTTMCDSNVQAVTFQILQYQNLAIDNEKKTSF